MFMNVLDLALPFQCNGGEIDGNYLFVAEVEVGIGRKPLGERPARLFPKTTNLKLAPFGRAYC